jgi:class 3 adenylate cyclase/tetratricopeptide (TPR) repeat protein
MRKCSSCGHENPPTQKFCGECGTRFHDSRTTADRQPYTPPHLAAKILRARSALEGERKPVTVLFCDIVDSTPLAVRLGGERMHSVLNAFFEASLLEVHRYEGTINQFLGDGFMALFGAPVSHEDHARRAVLAAQGIRQAIASPTFTDRNAALELRMGLHSGAVVVGSIGDNLRMDYTAVGDTTNIASRIQGQAGPGSILMSEAVWRATQAYVECRYLGGRMLKGKSEPIGLYELEQAHSSAGTPRSHSAAHALVGRHAELHEIGDVLTRVNEGEGGILGIVGEAGLGKSRLIEEARRLSTGMGLRWLQGDCLSFGKTLSYWSFRQVFRAMFGIDEGDDESVGWRKLYAGMSALFEPPQAQELLPYIGTLLAVALPNPMAERLKSVDSLAIGHQIFRATYLLCERSAQSNPLLIAFEDWHWADASSASLLEHLLPLANKVPIVFVIACRPEPDGPAESFRLLTSSEAEPALQRARVVRLAPLAMADSMALAERLLQGGRLPSQVRDMLLKQAQGNPFYLGEMMRTLRSTGAIKFDSDSGEWRITSLYGSIPLPDTIEGLILARIDRLEEEAKQVLKAAAVVGKSFFYSVVSAVTRGVGALDADLEQLRDAEFIDKKQTSPETEYVFKHPLIQQAAYDSLLDHRRREMHRQVAECIEHLFAGRLDPFFSMLAYHFARAEDWGKSQDYLFKAAEHADRLAADEEALELYDAVIQASERHAVKSLTSFQRAQLNRKIGDAHFRAGRHEQAEVALLDVLSRLGHRPPRTKLRLALAVVTGLAGHLLVGLQSRGKTTETGGLDPTEELYVDAWLALAGIHFFTNALHYAYDAMQLAKLTRKWPSSRGHVLGLSHVGLVLDGFFLFRAAERTHNRALELAASQEDRSVQGMVLQFDGLHRHQIGEWSKAVEDGKRAAELCRTAGNLRYQAAALVCQFLYLAEQGDPLFAQVGHIVAQLANETSDRQAFAWSLIVIGFVQQTAGDHEEAQATLKKGVDLLLSIPDPRLVAYSKGLRSVSLLKLGRTTEALADSVEACKLIHDNYLTGNLCTPPLLAHAEVRLAMLESAEPGSTQREKRQAAKQVKAMLRQGRKIRDSGAVESLRVAGAFEWMCGRQDKALKHWTMGLSKAEMLGAPRARARLLFERGRRTSSDSDLDEAAALFSQCAAVGELRELQALRGQEIQPMQRADQ